MVVLFEGTKPGKKMVEYVVLMALTLKRRTCLHYGIQSPKCTV
jgi:hypothetical protein